MVAPIQSSVGTSSSDPMTQDYLTELRNFYAKPQNQGVKSKFVAPNGSSFDIEDSNYLSTVTYNINTGKLDPIQKEANKSISKDADVSLDTSK